MGILFPCNRDPSSMVALATAFPLYVTVRAKTSLVHTSKFATLVLYNFCWVRYTDFKITGSVEQTSLYHYRKFELCVAF